MYFRGRVDRGMKGIMRRIGGLRFCEKMVAQGSFGRREGMSRNAQTGRF